MSAVRYSFSKYEGLGNDFLVVEQARFAELTPALAVKLCDRHFGVGADGVLITGLREGRPFMRVINADGSRPEMCGNGLRCVALYLADRGVVRDVAFEVATEAGPHFVRVLRDERGARVEVRMRPASLDAGDVLAAQDGRYIDQPFALASEQASERVTLSAVSMGNPHAVTFDPLRGREAELGPRIEKDPRFRAGANVGFAQVRAKDELELVVWERGVGFTLACGTGACAAAVAAVETGRASRHAPITVHLPGGPLTIRVGDPGTPIEMTGPARRVFDGEIEL
jgi:diaminopimelate epimerase